MCQNPHISSESILQNSLCVCCQSGRNFHSINQANLAKHICTKTSVQLAFTVFRTGRGQVIMTLLSREHSSKPWLTLIPSFFQFQVSWVSTLQSWSVGWELGSLDRLRSDGVEVHLLVPSGWVLTTLTVLVADSGSGLVSKRSSFQQLCASGLLHEFCASLSLLRLTLVANFVWSGVKVKHMRNNAMPAQSCAKSVYLCPRSGLICTPQFGPRQRCSCLKRLTSRVKERWTCSVPTTRANLQLRRTESPVSLVLTGKKGWGGWGWTIGTWETGEWNRVMSELENSKKQVVFFSRWFGESAWGLWKSVFIVFTCCLLQVSRWIGVLRGQAQVPPMPKRAECHWRVCKLPNLLQRYIIWGSAVGQGRTDHPLDLGKPHHPVSKWFCWSLKILAASERWRMFCFWCLVHQMYGPDAF